MIYKPLLFVRLSERASDQVQLIEIEHKRPKSRKSK